MLKGVHHRIVEIRQTEDPYFDRALLFVRAECAQDADWQEMGQAFLRRATPYTELCRARLYSGLRTALCMIGCGVAGTAVGMFADRLIR